jgi:cofilin
MSSGITPNPECAIEFGKLKDSKTYRYTVMKITADYKKVEVITDDCTAPGGTCEEDWKKFAEMCTGKYATEPLYAVFDFDWEAEDGHAASKILFVTWVPETAKIKSKMLTTSTKEAVKRALVGIGQDFQATDASEITYDCALDKCKSATTSG